MPFAQMAYMLGKEGGLWTHLSPNQRLALLLAALCHDYEHPGVSAAYLHKAKSRLASWFRGDPGLLEKHHSIRSFELLTCKHVGLLSHLPTADRIEVLAEPTRSTFDRSLTCGRGAGARAGAGRDPVHGHEPARQHHRRH